MITYQSSKELKMELKRLQDEFVTLKTAIEKALNEGQKSIDDLNNIPTSGMTPNRDFPTTYMNLGASVVGWVHDF